MKNIANLVIIAILLSGCEKVVELKYKGNQSRIIIEANISNQPGMHFVKITKSIPLPETANYLSVDNAMVTISDDAGNRETLSVLGNGRYGTTNLAGVEGRTYTLTVQAENQTYTAQSTMPQLVRFDSVKIEKLLVTGETEYNFIPVYNDPVATGNNYRFLLSVNGKLINQHFVQNDQVKNGLVNTVGLEINDDDLKFGKGDTISMKMQCIDRGVALFYTSLQLMGDSGPGGGTTPGNPPNNISNGALGIFSAHTVQEKINVVR